ncbi:PREDICTED: F-box/LRR-repeat protein At3g60040-like [Camelina sativa]|uniref:F-box/LRR-repeat protein At3g60040-like n=1 Tax=Camelina sativa TaxID=90675 RepID=A0ABM0Z9D9_CAMSA|nr:PREDICTED: F-box/LRR-repeat protein At3g60040-like [Camelina sativa]
MDAKSFDNPFRRDAISWLPDEVLGKILSFLPTKQAVSTSLLSTRWRYIFRLVDNLEFDDSFSLLAQEAQQPRNANREAFEKFLRAQGVDEQTSYVFTEGFKNMVDRTLALQCDYPIKKFSIKCHVGKDDDDSRKACVGRWISNVVGRGVSELDLRIKDGTEHFLPPLLFASKTLVKLTIGTQLYLGKLPSYVSLPSLKVLFIDSVFFEYEDLCCVFLAGCPVLEELLVHHKDFTGMPETISSPTVKRLSVYYDSPIDVYDDTSMSFDLPNLVYLEYSDCALAEYMQVNLDSLVEAKLDLYEAGNVKRRDVTNLVTGIRNVEILHLSPASVDVIYSYCRDGLPVFNNLVNLSFGCKNQRGWNLLADLLEQSPKLETLIIQDLTGYTRDVSMPLNQVKVLRVLNYGGTDEELKRLKNFLGGKCNAEVVDEGIRLQTNRILEFQFQ